MSNMSYCRFRNTLSDFEDCVNALEERDNELSPEEQRAAFYLIQRARELSEMFDGMSNEEIKAELSNIEDEE